MINCFQFCLNFAFKFNLRCYRKAMSVAGMSCDVGECLFLDDSTSNMRAAKAVGRGLHSFTFQLNLSHV
jgi:hypothetical protein